MKSRKKSLTVCYVLSYSSPKYVRTEFLLSSLRSIEGVKVHTAINSKKGSIRYCQTIWRLLLVRVRYRPDIYLLGFRGYEVFLPVRLLTIGKPLIFDEFINPYLWFIEEHRKFKSAGVPARLVWLYSKLILVLSQHVLSDTKLHAEYSSRKIGIPSRKFTPIYVGTNEDMFQSSRKEGTSTKKSLNVFFYGNFLPLHGMDVILDAAEKLKDEQVTFTIIGGAKRQRDMQTFLRQIKDRELTNIMHKAWVPYEDLPDYIAKADLCLGGPFGDTPQSRVVITGKTYQFLAMGKCAIIGKINEEVGFKDKDNCLLVDQGNVDALVNAIRWAMQNYHSLERIGHAGRQLYDEKFSQQAQSLKLEGVLRSIN